jgi:serine/threonine protein kinase/Tfp pilus assembly protein PilF
MFAMGTEDWAEKLRSARLAYELYRHRRDKGEAESESAFLRANRTLSDLLEPMLHEDDDLTSPLGDAATVAGRSLGEFRLVREIGRGGMGVVYEAQQPSLHRTVAVKVLPAHLTLRESTIQRFHREALTAAKFRHPGIVEIFTVGADRGVHYFAMEFVHGAPLDRVIAQLKTLPLESLDGGAIANAVRDLAHEPSDPLWSSDEGDDARPGAWDGGFVATAARLVASVADALDHAHRAGVIHRDVKPSNILVRADGTPVLTDFGLAREEGLPSMTLTGDFVGTPYYVSPQQVVSRSVKVDHRTDVFSLGVTLYELLTLRRPFEGESSQEIFEKILTREPVDPQKLNPRIASDLVTIILKALEKDPERRYATAGELAADLRAFLEYRPIRARRVPGVVRLARWARREPAKAALLAILSIGVPAATAAGGFALAKLRAARIEVRLYAKERDLKQGYWQLGSRNYRRAIGTFEAVLREEPETPEAIAGIVFARLELNEPEAALATLDAHRAVAEAHPSFAWIRADALRDAGQVAEAERLEEHVGEPESALDFFIAGYHELPRGQYGEPGDPARYAHPLELLTAAAMLQQRALFHFERARAAGLAKDPIAARESARTLLALWPDSARTWFHVGFALHYVDRERAIDAFRRAIALDPNDVSTYCNLASTLYDADDFQGALDAFNRAIALDPNDVDARCSLGVTLEQMGDPARAISALREAIRIDPKLASAWFDLGRAHHSMGDEAQAIAAYREAVRLDPKSARPHMHLGLAMVASGQPEHALAEYREAIRLDPAYALAHYNLGIALHEAGNDAAAILEYREAIRLDPTSALAQFNLGIALQWSKDVAGAIESYRRAIELNPKLTVARISLGSALCDSGDPDGGLSQLRLAVDADPKAKNAHLQLSRMLRERGALVAAREAAERWTIEIPDDSDAWSTLAFDCVDPEAAEQDPSRALDAATRAVELDPRSADAHASLAAVRVASGKPADAVDECRRALEIAPSHETAHIGLVDAIAATGDLAAARRELESWTAACPDSVQAWNRLAWFLVDPDGSPEQHDPVAGLAAARRAAAIAREVPVLDTLAQALFMNGDVAGAIDTEHGAIAAHERNPNANPRHRIYLERSLARFEKARE